MDDVPHSEDGYPRPCPTEIRHDDIFHEKKFAEVDKRAREADSKLMNSYGDLLEYLLKDATTDLAKVRSLFVWLSAQPVIKTTFPTVVRPKDGPQAWLKRIKRDRMVYTDFFALLCRKAGVPCVIIEGSSKGAGFEVGQKGPLKNTNRWNAVYLEKSWHLINVPWALITTEGLAEGEWDLVEKDGQAVREKEVTNKEVHEDLDEFWFLTDPDDFNAFCHAKQRSWQLLQNPWTEEEFLNAPRYAEDIFTSDWELVSMDSAVLKAKGGKCQIAFSHPPGARSATLTYNLYFNTSLSPKRLPEKLQLDRYVIENSKLQQKELLTRLPQDGVYRIEVAGVLDGIITGLGEFRIESYDVNTQPPPFPEGCNQIGYNEVAADAGLIEPSHEDGIVLQAKAGERVTFMFRLDGNKPRPPQITAVLTNNDRTPEELSGNVDVTTTKDDVNVSIQLPPGASNNEYGLCINALRAASADSDNQSQEISYHNLLNYIITQDTQLTFPETKGDIQNKCDLLSSIKNFNVSKFHESLKAAQNLDPVTRQKVDVFLAQINKIRGEKHRALVEAMRGSDVNDLERAMTEYEELGESDGKSIQQAKATLGLLWALKEDDNTEQLEKALRQVYDLKVKLSSSIERAEKTLIAHYGKDIADAYYKRTLAAIKEAFDAVEKSCVAGLLKQEFMFRKLIELQQHLEEMKKMIDKIAKLSSNDLTKMSGTKGKEPHPHVKSVLMATFILLGEREQHLWEWEVVQNLLQRRGEVGVSKVMAAIDIDKLTNQQADLAESHVRQCQLEVVKSENSNAALFLQWVLGTVEEKRGREAVKHHHTQIRNQ